MDTKRCCRCKNNKPITEFNRASKRPDGLRCECRECQYDYQNKPKYKEKVKLLDQGQKRCATCKEIKPLSAFYPHVYNGPNARHPTRVRSSCKLCEKPPKPKPTGEKLFWMKVRKGRLDECWEWTGYKGHFGYGQFMVDYQHVAAHRFSYEIHKGKIPDGLFVLHTCDNPGCVNPNHLYAGTQTDNMHDKIRRGRVRVTKPLKSKKR